LLKNQQNSTKLDKTQHFAKFHDMTQNLESVQTFSIEFSGASGLQNLKLHIKMCGWTRGKPKRLTGSGAKAQKATKFSK
jgi:hypothetical protein